MPGTGIGNQIDPGVINTPLLIPATNRLSIPWAIWVQAVSNAINSSSHILNGTRTDRAAIPAASYPGSAYFESDTGLTYISIPISGTYTWIYGWGTVKCTQANLPTGLTVDDRYLVANVTDYRHKLIWGGEDPGSSYTGTWDFESGDGGSGYIVLSEVNLGSGWALCNGASVTYLNGNGTVSSIGLVDPTTNNYYLKIGGTNSGPHLPTNTGNDVGGGQVVQSGTGVTVAAHTHVHTPGEPANIVRKAYFRI
jgi:hypothetical protein